MTTFKTLNNRILDDIDQKHRQIEAMIKSAQDDFIERQRQGFREKQESQRHLARLSQAQVAATGNLEAMSLAHTLDKDVRDRDFADLVRSENMRLQALQKELAIRDLDRKREAETDVNKATRLMMAELVKLYAIKKLGLADNSQNEVDLEKMEAIFSKLSKDFST